MAHKLREVAFLAGLALLAQSASAQGVSPLVSRIISNSNPLYNMIVTASVADYAQNQYVSGTNQNFTAGLSLCENPGYTGQNAWTGGWLTDATIKIGGEAIETWTAPPGTTRGR